MFDGRILTRFTRSPRNNRNEYNINNNDHDINSELYNSTGRVHQDVPPQQQPPLPPKQQQQQQQQRKGLILLRPSITTPSKIITDWHPDERSEFERKYDLTPVADNNHTFNDSNKRKTPSYTIDPYEFSPSSTPEKSGTEMR
jgi:hypothetical protein